MNLPEISKIKFSNIILVIICAAVGIALSGYLAYSHYARVPQDSILFRVCSVSGIFNCEAVNTGRYSVLFGLPVAIWGLFYYIFLLTALIFRESETDIIIKNAFLLLLSALSLVSAAAVIALFIISQFIIKALCLFCILTWIVNIIIFILMIRLMKSEGGGSLFGTVVSFFKSGLALLPGLYKNTRILLFAFYMMILFTFLYTLNNYLSLSKTVRQVEDRVKQEAGFINNYDNYRQVQVSTAGLPVFIGNADAKISIVEFMNFDCGACRKGFVMIKPVVEKYREKVKLYLKNFPLDGQCNPSVTQKKGGLSCAASLIAAGLYGRPGFGGFVEAIMREKDRLNPQLLLGAVSAAGISSAEADSFIKGARTRSILAAEIDEAIRIGINATPTFIINGRVLPAGAINPDLFERVLQIEIKRVYGE